MRILILLPHLFLAALGGVVTGDGAFVGLVAQSSGEFFVNRPIEEVFPLFGAEEESKWAPGWRPLWIVPTAKEACRSLPQQGWVFKTDASGPDERIWFVERFDVAQHEAVYIVHLPDRMVYRIDIRSVPRESGTQTYVTYAFRGLSPQGNREIEERTTGAAAFAAEMAEWGHLIYAFLAARR